MFCVVTLLRTCAVILSSTCPAPFVALVSRCLLPLVSLLRRNTGEPHRRGSRSFSRMNSSLMSISKEGTQLKLRARRPCSQKCFCVPVLTKTRHCIASTMSPLVHALLWSWFARTVWADYIPHMLVSTPSNGSNLVKGRSLMRKQERVWRVKELASLPLCKDSR